VSPSKRIPVSTTLPVEVFGRWKRYSRKSGKKMCFVVEQALDVYLKVMEKKERASTRTDK